MLEDGKQYTDRDAVFSKINTEPYWTQFQAELRFLANPPEPMKLQQKVALWHNDGNITYEWRDVPTVTDPEG